MTSFCGRNNDPGKGILNTLKPTKRVLWKIIEERIAIIKLRRNKSISQKNGRVTVKRGPNLT